MEKEESISSLVELIQQQADNKILEISRDFEINRQSILDEYKKLAEEETNVFIEQELLELKEKILQSETQAKWKIKKDLFVKRQELVDNLFEEIQLKIQAFVKSNEYKEWLKTRLSKIIEVSNTSNNLQIKCRKMDVDVISSLVDNNIISNIIEDNEEIHLGGFILVDPVKKVETDETLDYQVRVQKEWFYANSKLNF